MSTLTFNPFAEAPCATAVSDLLCTVARGKPLDEHAKQVYEWATDLNPDNHAAWNGLGMWALNGKYWDSALGYFKKALHIKVSAAVLVNAALAADHLHDLELAWEFAERARHTDPQFALAYQELFSIHEQRNERCDAYQIIEQGLERCPGNHQLLFARATLRLSDGDYENGLIDFEHRHWAATSNSRGTLPERLDNCEAWDGTQPLKGKTILVCREAGLGDEIMFSRYLPLLAERGGQIMLHTYPELARLFADSYPFCRVVTFDGDIGDVDYWVASGSLLYTLLRPEYDSQQGFSWHGLRSAPYIKSGDAVILPGTGLRVGLNWRGSPGQLRDEFRSLPYGFLNGIREVPGCTFYSLQYRDQESDLFHIADYTMDLADLARYIKGLDLVITCDSMPAHIAGALGVSVWMMEFAPAYWPWGHKGSGTPWYPSMRVFRQENPLEWDDVLGDVRTALLDESKTFNAPLVHNGTQAQVVNLSVGDITCGTLTTTEKNAVSIGDTRYGRMSWHTSDFYIGRSLAEYGEYSQGEADLFEAILKLGDIVVEAGANIGALTLPIAKAVGLGGRVHAFEPQPCYAELLRLNCPVNVDVNQAALGETEKTFELESAETHRVSAPSWRYYEGRQFECSQYTIDLLGFLRLDFIKIDVDGQELDILRGCERTINEHQPVIYCENDKTDLYPNLIPWLEDHGYRVYEHMPRLFNPNNFKDNKVNVFGNIVSAMLFCVPRVRYDLDALAIQFSMSRLRTRKAA